MSSSQGDSPAPLPKSKQERIRDNQRRSRHRRQEYLADLEKRLRDCHTLCRDADIQRSACIDLQKENACLRTLLGLSGVSNDQVDSFVRQNAQSSAQQQSSTEAGSSLRHLKPKMPVSQSSTGSSVLGQANADISGLTPRSCCRSLSAGGPTAQNNAYSNIPQLYDASPATSVASTSPLPDSASMHSLEDFQWLFDQLPQLHLPPQSADDSERRLCCGEFGVLPNSSTYADDRNSVLCSVARDLLSLQNIPPHEMEGIKIRLASGLSRPDTDKECRVNSHMLFQILSEVTASHA